MKSHTDIQNRMNNSLRGVGHDMAPPIVNASRVAYVQALNWVLDNPISEDKLDNLWHEESGIKQENI